MMRSFAAVALLLVCSCDEWRAPIDRTGDLIPGFRRSATTEMPGAEDIRSACAGAFFRWVEEQERVPGTYISELSMLEQVVRNPVCEWDPDAASTVECRFEESAIASFHSTVEEREAALRRLRDDDWSPGARARLVFAANRVGRKMWIAPQPCIRAPREERR